METEIEAKFPNVDVKDLRARLLKMGAIQEYPEVLMRRKNFDFPDNRLYKINGWVRVRDEGNKITLAYKKLEDRTLHGMKEVSVEVGSYVAIINFLKAIGLEEKSDQETKREKWNYEGVEITIDTWPWVPSFVEIEGATEVDVKRIAQKLEFDWSTAMYGSVETIYHMHYDFTDAEIDKWESITFIPEPEWLLARKK